MRIKMRRVIRPGYYVPESGGRLTVIICSNMGEDATIYFVSTEGNYVGRESIFTHTRTTDIPPTAITLDDARITVYYSRGRKV